MMGCVSSCPVGTGGLRRGGSLLAWQTGFVVFGFKKWSSDTPASKKFQCSVLEAVRADDFLVEHFPTFVAFLASNGKKYTRR